MEEILKCYQVLGLSPGASQKEIKKAYRDLVKTWHPDQFTTDSQKRGEAEQRLRAINLAFERLQDIGTTFDLVAALRSSYAAAPHRETPASAKPSQPPPSANSTTDPKPPSKNAHTAPPPAVERDFLNRLEPAAIWRRILVGRWSTIAGVVLGGIAIATPFFFDAGSKQKQARHQAAERIISLAEVSKIPSAAAVANEKLEKPKARWPEAGAPELPAFQTGPEQSAIGEINGSTPTQAPEPGGDGLRTGAPGKMNADTRPTRDGLKDLKAVDVHGAVTNLPTDPARDQAVVDMELQFRMGLRFAQGNEVERDYAEAAKWYRRAAESGHSQAQKNLGYLYASGKGVPRDYAEAERWFRMAASQSGSADPLANAVLAAAKAESERARATALASNPESVRTAEAQFALGQRYASGDGVPRDYVQAAKWLRLAAEAGHAMAQKNLGYFYLSGKGVPINHAEAEKWLRKAAAQGAPGADLTAAILSISKQPAEEN